MNRFKLKECICILGLLCGALSAVEGMDLSGVHGYPVPFNPKKSSTKALSIDFSSASLPLACLIKMSVFDINGDSVCSRSFTNAGSVKWNGRNDSGKLVGQGLYIIKLEVEEPSGDYGKKIIRVLIAY